MSIARSQPPGSAPPVRATGARGGATRGNGASAGHTPVEARITLRSPLDVRSTLGPLRHGPGDPGVVIDDSGVWLAFRTPAGAVTLLVTGSRTEVHLRAWGSGASEALLDAPRLLGLDDDWSDLDTSAFELLAASAHRNPGLRLCRTGRVLDSLAPAIVEQKVTSVEAFRAWRLLAGRYGDPAPGPWAEETPAASLGGPASGSGAGHDQAGESSANEPASASVAASAPAPTIAPSPGPRRYAAPARMRLPLLPEQWRRIPSWEWHRAGVDPRRSKAVIRAAEVAGSLERSTSAHPGGEAVWNLLRTVNGVGGWTAAETAQRSHGDPDAVSFGDYHLAATVGRALVGEPIDDDALAELLEPWAGQRQRIVRLVLASGFKPPRHGPRLTIQDHRAH